MSKTIEAEFDSYANQYEEALGKGLSVSGENSEYFATKRIAWTAKVLNRNVDSILDFGCGVGIAEPLLNKQFSPKTIVGYDPSSAAIARAKLTHAKPSTQFICDEQEIPADHFDLAYCNGVFHHIPIEIRPKAFATVFNSLKPGGSFAFWENNPWNPGTRYVMSKIPFDRDAITISPAEAKSILTAAGFEMRCCHAWFLFPRMLKWFRPVEYLFHRLPIGAQYLMLVSKPDSTDR